MTEFIITREAPAPTVEQLGREVGCCDTCKAGGKLQTSLLPPDPRVPELMLLADLAVTDALDGPADYGNVIGIYAKKYDLLNNTKHEVFRINPTTVRCWRMK